MTDSEIPVQEVEELFALQRALQRTQGFALYVARVNTRMLRRDINDWLSENVMRPIQEIRLNSRNPIVEQIAQSAEDASVDSILSVYGLEELSTAEETEWLQSQLNWRRSSFQKIKHTILLWLPEYLLTLLMESAPDFFDWHSGLYEFTTSDQDIQHEYKRAMVVWDQNYSPYTILERDRRVAALKGLLHEYSGDRENLNAQWHILNTIGTLYGQSEDDAKGKAITYYQQALDIAIESGDQVLIGNALGNLGVTYSDSGDVQRAIAFYEQALVVSREVGDRRFEGITINNLGNAYIGLGESSQAIEYMEKALSIFREIGNQFLESFGLSNLGYFYNDLGETRRAIEYYEQSLVLARESGSSLSESRTLHRLGIVYAKLGEIHRAIEYFEQALVLYRSIDNEAGESELLGDLARAYKGLGETRQTMEFYEKALEITREFGDKQNESTICWNMGQLLEEQGEFQRAAELMQIRVDFYKSIRHPQAEELAKRVEEVRHKAVEQGIEKN